MKKCSGLRQCQLVACLVTAVFTGMIHAPDAEATIEAYALGGGWSILPVAYYRGLYTDNLYLEPASKKESGFIHTPGSSIELGYESSKIIYNNTSYIERDIYENSMDNFIGMGSEGLLAYTPLDRHYLEISGSISREQVQRGVGRSAYGNGQDESLDKFLLGSVDGKYVYGVNDSIARLRLLSGLEVKNYFNNSSFTDELNYHSLTIGGGADAKIGGKTYLLFETLLTEIYYEGSSPTAKRKEASVITSLLGMSWDISGSTTGSAKFGYTQRDFHDADVDDKSGLAWQVSLEWMPDAINKLTLESRSSFQESDLPSSTTLDRTASVSYERDISVFYDVLAGFDYTVKDYTESASEETKIEYFVGVNYYPTKHLGMNFKYAWSYRNLNLVNITDRNLDYIRNSFGFGLNYAF